jgi:hypothetical protein
MQETASDRRIAGMRIPQRSAVRTFCNFALAQAGWLACVLSAAADRAWLGIAATCVLIGVHLTLSAERRSEVLLVLTAGFVGAATDTLLAQLAFLRFEGGIAPLWMIALWMLFATTLRSSLAWLRTHLAVAAVVGALGGPAAYAAGERLGALEIPDVWTSYAAIGVAWALALPLLLLFAHRGRASLAARSGAARKAHA